MNFILEIPHDVKEMLQSGETIIWCDKPHKSPFVLKRLIFAIIASPWLVIPIIFLINVPLTPPLIIFLAFWYGLLGFTFLGIPIYAFLVWKNIYYILTNRRIIVRKGLVGIDYDVLNLENIQQVKLDVGFWDKIYGTGTLTILSMGVPPIILYSVKNPRKVYNIINEAIRNSKQYTVQEY